MTPDQADRPDGTVSGLANSTGRAGAADAGQRPSRLILPLYIRLAILLAAVLLPAVAYSVLSAYSGYRESQARTQETIARFGALAAGRAELLLDSTRRLLVALAATDFAAAANEGKAQCTRDLGSLAGAFAEYSAFAVVSPEGEVVCSSAPETGSLNVADRPWFQQVQATREVAISQLTRSKLNGTPVVAVSVPLGGQGEKFRGALSVGINVLWLAGLSTITEMPPQTSAVLIDRAGMVVTRSGRLISVTDAGEVGSGDPDIGALPAADALRSALDHHVTQFTGKGSDGIARLYSLTSLSHADLFVVLGVPESSSIGWARSDFLNRLFAVMAMLLCALVGVAVGGDLLVARNLRALSATAEALQRGDYGARPQLKGGSREVRQLADTLTSMAERVERHEQDMNRSVQQKEAMLKEIHHRVKNNLQVVTSLMSIQANRLSDEASKRALAELQRRVRALGLLHRHLYEGDDLRYLDFGQFTVELCQMVKESSGPTARGVTVDVDIPPIPITADRAVPLGLLITEALGNALKHGFPGGRPGVIRISLTVTPEGVATISISDNGIGPPALSNDGGNDPNSTAGTGMLLMQAFAQQLGSMLTVEGPPGTTVKFSFDLAEPGIIAPA